MKRLSQTTQEYANTFPITHLLLIGVCLLAICMHFAFILFVNTSVVGGYPIASIPLIIGAILTGIPVLVQIVKKLIQGNFGVDILAALSIGTAIFLGEYMAALLIVLMLSTGQILELYATKKASSALLSLVDRMPTSVHLKEGKAERNIPPNEIQVGDTIVVYPHETCPVDGVVVEGYGSMDESYLTGEPYQIDKIPGSKVLSGSINGNTLLVIRTEKIPAESRYAQIMKVMSEAEQKRPTIRRLSDQLGMTFTPFAILFALGSWYMSGDVIRFLAVMVIATPCPLIIAVPITIISAISMAARQGIIIKDPTVLEQLPICRTAIFDKTGTLTYGKPELTRIIAAPGISEDNILQLAASLERYSKHNLASAIILVAQKKNLPFIEVSKLSEIPGQGLSGIIEGMDLTITHRTKFLQTNPEMAGQFPETTIGLECLVLLEGKYAAVFQFQDTLRADVKSFIRHLRPFHKFDKVMIVSGDRKEEVQRLGQILNISKIFASQTPEQKLAIVRQETAMTPTVFMGDGINDAPALEAATVGVAFGEFSTVTAAAAGAVIMDNSLAKVDVLNHLSMSTRRIALQSAIGGMVLSGIGMSFAAFGYIQPVVGALLQEGIDVLAILNALRLIWKTEIETDLFANFKSRKGTHKA